MGVGDRFFVFLIESETRRSQSEYNILLEDIVVEATNNDNYVVLAYSKKKKEKKNTSI